MLFGQFPAQLSTGQASLLFDLKGLLESAYEEFLSSRKAC